MSGPTFEYVPIIQDRSVCHLQVAYVSGLSTKHGSTDTDRGRLYGAVSRTGGTYVLELFSDVSRATDRLVLRGETTSIRTHFELVEQNDSHMSGRAWIESLSVASYTGLILIPTFATDRDIFVDAGAAANMPGFTDDFGLAEVHALAMQEILTDALPRALPNFFGGSGLAAFVPQSLGVELPDLTKLANGDQLRVAQSALAKAISAEMSEHVEQMAALSAKARKRYEKVMQRLAEANITEQEAGEADDASESVGVVNFGRN